MGRDVLVEAVLVERGRVVVQHVEPTERRHRVGHHCLDRDRIGDVDHVSTRHATLARDYLGDRVRGVGRDVGHGHRRALAGKQERGRTADAGPTTRHDCDLAGESRHAPSSVPERVSLTSFR
jgi:hypothetical protein